MGGRAPSGIGHNTPDHDRLFVATCGPTTIGSSPTHADFTDPPFIDFNEVTTYPDGRLVTDPRFAAVLLTASGEVRLFDDIGRMVTQRAVSDQAIVAAWVHDYDHDRWLPADAAVYVASPNLATPRGSGLLAVDSAERALLLILDLGGPTLALDELADYLVAGLTDAPLPSSGGTSLGGLLEADK